MEGGPDTPVQYLFFIQAVSGLADNWGFSFLVQRMVWTVRLLYMAGCTTLSRVSNMALAATWTSGQNS